MKKFITTIIIVILGFTKMYCQTNPQYEFYSNYDISSLTGGVKNCVEEAKCIEYALGLHDILRKDSLNEVDRLLGSLYLDGICLNNGNGNESNYNRESILIKVMHLNDRQRIDMLTRLYEIENTCYIRYATKDGNKINFQSAADNNEKNLIPVDFGAQLVSNGEYGNNHVLKFANPITKIDANLFNENIEMVRLPKNTKLSYINNATKNVSNLSWIEGRDAFSDRELISSDSTLIVVATAYLSEYSVPDCVRIIGNDCFRNCGLVKVMIPESVSKIESSAFSGCTNLNELHIQGNTVIELCENAFDENKGATWSIYVPKKILKQYKKKYPYLKKRLVGIK